MSAGQVLPGPAQWLDQPEPVEALSFADLADEYLARARVVAEAVRTGKRPGLTSGFAKLDDALGGWMEPGLYALHADPGNGKSALMLQMAVDSGGAGLYVSCEMPAMSLLRRHVARVNRVNSHLLARGRQPEAREKEFLDAAILQAMNLRVLDGTDHKITPRDIAREVRRLKEDHEHVMVVVDSIQPWSEANGADLGLGEYEAIARAIGVLRTIAKTTNTVVWFLSERKKGTSKDGGLQSMAGHRRLGHGPDVVMELLPETDEEAYARQHFSDTTTITLRINKNRDGKRGQVKLNFTGGIQTFTETRG